MWVSQGMKKWHPPSCVTLSLKTMCGLKNAAHAFWHALVNAMRRGKFKQSKADPCLFFAWTVFGLAIWMSWVDDCVVMGKKEGALMAKKHSMKQFLCEEQFHVKNKEHRRNMLVVRSSMSLMEDE